MLISSMERHWWGAPWSCWQMHKSHIHLPPNKEQRNPHWAHFWHIYVHVPVPSSLHPSLRCGHKAKVMGMIDDMNAKHWTGDNRASPCGTMLTSDRSRPVCLHVLSPCTWSGPILKCKVRSQPSGQWDNDIGAITRLRLINQSALGITYVDKCPQLLYPLVSLPSLFGCSSNAAFQRSNSSSTRLYPTLVPDVSLSITIQYLLDESGVVTPTAFYIPTRKNKNGCGRDGEFAARFLFLSQTKQEETGLECPSLFTVQSDTL